MHVEIDSDSIDLIPSVQYIVLYFCEMVPFALLTYHYVGINGV